MRYRLLGQTGLYVSELCLGTMTYGGGGAGIWASIGKLQQDAVDERRQVESEQRLRPQPGQTEQAVGEGARAQRRAGIPVGRRAVL